LISFHFCYLQSADLGYPLCLHNETALFVAALFISKYKAEAFCPILSFLSRFKDHWEVLASVDFTTIEVWTKKGLVTYYLLFFMELATRRVHLAGITANPDEGWMLQVARNVTDAEQGFLRGKRYLLMNRDSKYSETYRITLTGCGVKPVRLPPHSPNLNAYLERFMRAVKEECLERMIFFGERSLRGAAASFLEHFHRERNHQGIGNRLITPEMVVGRTAGEIECRERLGGMLRYYYRKAA
jgi:putative transposase